MKNDFMLQNMIENGSNFNFGEPKPKKSSRVNQQELQLQIGITFNEICELLESNHIRTSITHDGMKSIDKVNAFKTIVEQLL